MINKFLTALKFMTVLPAGPSLGDLKNACMFFPVAGMIVGIAASAVNILARQVFPANVAVTFALLSLILLTGALHLDGFADTIDGFSGGKTKEDVFRIMDSSTIGSFAAVAVAFLLVQKLILFFNLSEENFERTVIVMATASRWASVIALAIAGPAKKDGLAFGIWEGMSKTGLVISTLFTVLAAYLLLETKGVAILVSVFLYTAAFASYMKRKLGGMTGDTSGALIETTEMLVLLLMCVKI